MPDILQRVGAMAPVDALYRAVATPVGIAGWWSKETSGGGAIGDRITSTFTNPDTGELVGTIGYRLEELVPGTRVAWRMLAGVPEWEGTLVRFDLTEADGYTIVNFGHEGWAEASEFMGHCSTKWATFLVSLKSYAETGTGQPAPADVQISNWH